jgi:hypothetical protein
MTARSAGIANVLNRSQMLEMFKAVGAKKPYKPFLAVDSDKVMLEVRKTAAITEGVMSGTECNFDRGEFRVWTSKKRLVKSLAAERGLTCRLYDGEGDLWIPGNLADELLPLFGVKVKRTMTDEHKAAARVRLEALNLKNKPLKKALPAMGS